MENTSAIFIFKKVQVAPFTLILMNKYKYRSGRSEMMYQTLFANNISNI